MNQKIRIAIALIGLLLFTAWTNNNSQFVRAANTGFESHYQNSITTFAVIGDYGLAGQPEADVAALVKSWNPDFIVTVGDNNYQKGSAESIDQNIGQYYHDYIFPYRGKYGSGATTKKFFPALGNHDWGNNGAKPYYDYFSFYNQRGYYDGVQGPVHLFIVDSDQNEPDGVLSTSKQAKWLKTSLASSTSPFNIVVFHHAPYSSGWHGSTAYMQWPFKDWGADAVIAGHDHIYERLLVNEIPYFVNGIGGAELYNFGTILPESKSRFNSDYGAMRVEATSTTMKFQMFTRAGILVDEFLISNTIPTVSSLTRVNASPTNANVVDFALTFTEPVTGVDAGDFAIVSDYINDASIANIIGVETNYIVSVNTGTTNGTLQLKLADDDSIVGLASNPLGGAGLGNGNALSNEIYTVDKTPPTILSIARINTNPTNALSLDYSVSFSEPVTGVNGDDFFIFSSNPSGAFVSNVLGSDNAYTVSVNTGNGDTTLRLDMMANNSISDAAGNTMNSNFTNGEVYTVDKSTPTITSIIRSGSMITNSSSVDFIVTASEPVTGLDASDFIVTTPSINGAFIGNIVDSNPFYVVTVITGTGDGTIHLDLIDNDSIVNALGTSLGNTGPGNGSFTSGENYTVDKTPPVATSITRASTNPSSASSVDYIVTFSEKVNGVDNADFILSTDLVGASISKITNADPFYVVSVNTGSGSGSLKLDLSDNDSIVDAAGNPLGNFGVGNGIFTNGDSFTVIKEIANFPSPTLLEPRRNLLTNNPQPAFSWAIVRNARAYEITIALDENFSQIILSQILDRPAFKPLTPLSDGIHYWKVRAYNSDLLPGKYSSPQVFVVDRMPPTPPSPASPADHSSTLKRPWLQWTATTDSVQFFIQVDNTPDFAKPEFTGTSTRLYIRAENLSRGIYYWRVAGKDSAGNWSTWSPPFEFKLP